MLVGRNLPVHVHVIQSNVYMMGTAQCLDYTKVTKMSFLSISDQLTTQMESVSIKTEGDMASLDIRTRISLAMLLDPTSEGADWL